MVKAKRKFMVQRKKWKFDASKKSGGASWWSDTKGFVSLQGARNFKKRQDRSGGPNRVVTKINNKTKVLTRIIKPKTTDSYPRLD
tara:strand:+ start:14763 stop:15017 length:255 start_codon:yes stop_codon:yes gene_type:complete